MVFDHFHDFRCEDPSFGVLGAKGLEEVLLQAIQEVAPEHLVLPTWACRNEMKRQGAEASVPKGFRLEGFRLGGAPALKAVAVRLK